MTETLVDLWSQALQACQERDWDRALRRCVVLLQGAPDSFEARMKVGDILLEQGLEEQAIQVFKVIAWHFTKAGHPLLAIVAVKMLTAFEESYNDVLEVLAHLYSVESDRVSSEARVPRLPRLESIELTEAGRQVDQVVALSGRPLAELAARLALDERGLDRYPEALPAIPLFSELPEDAFIEVLRQLELVRLASQGLVLREGDPGDSFYLLARGRVEVTKRVGGERLILARLGDGAVFGEMALMSDQPRAATVRATTHLELLKLGRAELEREANRLQSVARALKRFTRSRMLSNLMALSPVFRRLPVEDRRALLERFISTEVPKGKVILEEGKPGPGLFVILRGEVEVKKRDADSLVPLALLGVGDVFGEISLVGDVPTTATVIAGSDAELLLLSRKELESYVAHNPELKRTLTAISEQRLEATARLMAEPDLLADDEFVLV